MARLRPSIAGLACALLDQRAEGLPDQLPRAVAGAKPEAVSCNHCLPCRGPASASASERGCLLHTSACSGAAQVHGGTCRAQVCTCVRHACLDAAAWKLPIVEEPQGGSFTKAVGVLLPYLLSHRSRIASFRQIQPDEEAPGRHESRSSLPEVCRECVGNNGSAKSWADVWCKGVTQC